MPILPFGGVTPSGASARAVLAFPKGKKTRFGGAKWRPEKLSTIWWLLWITPGLLEFVPTNHSGAVTPTSGAWNLG